MMSGTGTQAPFDACLWPQPAKWWLARAVGAGVLSSLIRML
jgi:hypothetical protein